jgi:hypothetical protein
MAKDKNATAVAEQPVMNTDLFKDTQDYTVQSSGFAPNVISPYVWFPNQRSGLWSTALRQHPTLTPECVCLVDGQEVEILRPFRFILMASCYYLVQEDGQGQAVKTWRESPVEGENPKLSEWFEAMICVLRESDATLARCRFARTKSTAPKIVSSEISEASEPSWINGDQLRKYAASMPDPRFRVVGEFTSVTRTSRSSGLTYQTLQGVARPINPTEMLAVGKLSNSPEFRPLLDRIKKDFNSSLADLNRKLVK